MQSNVTNVSGNIVDVANAEIYGTIKISILTSSEFARAAVVHGPVAVVSDPHEIDIIKVSKVTSANPILHYGLDAGMLRVGDYADFLEIDNLKNFTILKTCINGEIVACDQNLSMDNIEITLHLSFQDINLVSSESEYQHQF